MNEIRWDEWPDGLRLEYIGATVLACEKRAQCLARQLSRITMAKNYDDDERRAVNRELVQVGNFINDLKLLAARIRQQERLRAERVRREIAVQQRREESASSV